MSREARYIRLKQLQQRNKNIFLSELSFSYVALAAANLSEWYRKTSLTKHANGQPLHLLLFEKRSPANSVVMRRSERPHRHLTALWPHGPVTWWPLWPCVTPGDWPLQTTSTTTRRGCLCSSFRSRAASSSRPDLRWRFFLRASSWERTTMKKWQLMIMCGRRSLYFNSQHIGGKTTG